MPGLPQSVPLLRQREPQQFRLKAALSQPSFSAFWLLAQLFLRRGFSFAGAGAVAGVEPVLRSPALSRRAVRLPGSVLLLQLFVICNLETLCDLPQFRKLFTVQNFNIHITSRFWIIQKYKNELVNQ
jgi:hypothetical protein